MTAAPHTAPSSYKQYVAVYVAMQAAGLEDHIKALQQHTVCQLHTLQHSLWGGVSISLATRLVTVRLGWFKWMGAYFLGSSSCLCVPTATALEISVPQHDVLLH